jgi:hypothetical protein
VAETSVYYHAAYIVAGALYVLYAISLVVRRRRVLERLAALGRDAKR